METEYEHGYAIPSTAFTCEFTADSWYIQITGGKFGAEAYTIYVDATYITQ